MSSPSIDVLAPEGTTADEAARDDPIRRALAEDLDAGFVLLFETYQRLLFSTALRVSGRWADAEDLTADAFLRAYRALGDYPADRIATLRPRAWLVTILLNGWRNRQRSSVRHPTAPLDSAPEVVDPRPDVEDIVTGRETGAELGEQLAELAYPQRVAVVLRHVGELSIAEIAEVLGCAEGTVKSHISRGLARLRVLSAERAGTTDGGVR
ncbi:RNA polymerase sigma factor [Pseudonocardia spinosispora]|uniref:RNA polymerase sigma factor n=1 Tax=Pseudonocardia spinosispora TaxID=103441 RepID=UPI000407D672|nr:RNA polymerase sigma factor [Pseudonocardia spinosispora]